jgi:predicted nucleic acid-binding protein
MSKVYLDSCMIIGLIEGDARQQQLLKSRLRSHRIFSSELARLESRILAIRQNNEIYLQRFDLFFEACEIIELNRAVFERATALRVEHNLKTPDSLHLAAAIQASCDEFWTNDQRLAKAANEHLIVVDWAILENDA